jgi:hypothetical protein
MVPNLHLETLMTKAILGVGKQAGVRKGKARGRVYYYDIELRTALERVEWHKQPQVEQAATYDKALEARRALRAKARREQHERYVARQAERQRDAGLQPRIQSLPAKAGELARLDRHPARSVRRLLRLV